MGYSDYLVLYAIIGLVSCFIWGGVTSSIMQRKGYSGAWFWFGFFLGIIGMIVALCRKESFDDDDYTYRPRNTYSGANYTAMPKPAQSKGAFWTCSCGRTVLNTASFCSSCGKKRPTASIPAASTAAKPAANPMDESKKIAAIKEYKDLLDAGVITQEEFDKKKQQLLG